MDEKDAEFVNKMLSDSIRKGYINGKLKIKPRQFEFGKAHESVCEFERDYVREFMDTYML